MAATYIGVKWNGTYMPNCPTVGGLIHRSEKHLLHVFKGKKQKPGVNRRYQGSNLGFGNAEIRIPSDNHYTIAPLDVIRKQSNI